MKIKQIKINTESEYREFLEKLKRYRGLLYRNTRFEISSALHNERIRDMETALNIKNRRQRIEYLYDRACDIVDEYNNKNGIICHYSAEGICEDPKHQKNKNGCCFICYLQSPEGCPTKNLSCKLFYCDHMCSKYVPITMDDIDLLKLFTWSQREIIKSNEFLDRKTYIDILWVGSYMLFCLYSIRKLFRMRKYI